MKDRIYIVELIEMLHSILDDTNNDEYLEDTLKDLYKELEICDTPLWKVIYETRKK